MKTKFIARAVAVFVAVPILVVIQAPNGSADIAGYGNDEFSAVAPCANKARTFPTLIFTRIKTSLNGSYSGFEIHLSNKAKSCSTILYAFIAAKK